MLTDYKTIDVTKIPKPRRRETILEQLLKLQPHEGRVLKVDHDPKPLFDFLTVDHQMDLEWRHLEEGPTWWEVLIVKRSGSDSMRLDDFIGNNLARMLFFANYDPRVCLNRNQTLGEFCQHHNLELIETYQAASQINSYTQPHFDYWKLSLFVEFIIENYHRYERKLINDTKEILDKVQKAHGHEWSFLSTLASHYDSLMLILFDHFQEEEDYFFDLLKFQGSQDALESSYRHVEHDHDESISVLISIKKLTNNFTPPGEACGLTKMLYSNLESLHNDLLCHTFIEEKFLGPMVAQ
ncbi:MAG: DUF2249 domain-containing protein [Cyclobacteriaceae bacterium]